MAQIDSGPATGNGVQTFTLPGGPVVTGVEIHVPLGLPSLEPSRAVFVDPSSSYNNVTAAPFTPINTSLTFGNTGATSRIANPA